MSSNKHQYKGMAMNISENTTETNQDSLSKSNLSNPEKTRKQNPGSSNLSD